MALTLAMIRCPAGVVLDRREQLQQTLVIGRGAECDWVLPDPEKILSKRHCRVDVRGNEWFVTDSSANGTQLNGSALESEFPHKLRHNDRLTLGSYEIEARIGTEAVSPDEAPTRFGVRLDDVNEARLTSDPFSPDTDDAVEAARPSIGLPLDFDALAEGDKVPETPFAAADDTPDLHAHFRAPRPVQDLLPADWDLDDEPATAPPGPAAPAAPAEISAEVAPASEPGPPSPAPASRQSEAAQASRDGFAAFLAGAGVSGGPPADPAAVLRELGAAFRAMVSGLRQSMIARASVKSEFRIGQTMIRASGNNPLKFSADDEDALAGLLGIGRPGTMGASRSVAEALRDIRLHELAVAAALQSAVHGLLADIAPEKITAALRDSPLDDLLGRRKQAAWDAYTKRHAATLRALSDEFDSVFGRAFARAYETALAEIAAQDDADLDEGREPDLPRHGRPS